MIINLNKEYRIRSETQQWVAQKLVSKGKQGHQWTCVGFYADFESCIVGISNRRVREIDSEIPDHIIQTIKDIKSDAQQAVLTFTKQNCLSA